MHASQLRDPCYIVLTAHSLTADTRCNTILRLPSADTIFVVEGAEDDSVIPCAMYSQSNSQSKNQESKIFILIKILTGEISSCVCVLVDMYALEYMRALRRNGPVLSKRIYARSRYRCVIWRPMKGLALTSSATVLSALHTENELDVVMDALRRANFRQKRVYRFTVIESRKAIGGRRCQKSPDLCGT